MVMIDTTQSNLICEMWADIKEYRVERKYSDSIIVSQSKTIKDQDKGIVIRDSISLLQNQVIADQSKTIDSQKKCLKTLKIGFVVAATAAVIEFLVLIH